MKITIEELKELIKEEILKKEEVYDPAPTQDELNDNAVIGDARGGGYALAVEGKYIDTFEDFDDALAAFKKWTKKHNFFPSLYYVNDHGNVDLLDPQTGSTIRGWV